MGRIRSLWWLAAILTLLLTARAPNAQNGNQASLLLEAAMQRQQKTGDFAAAIRDYEAILVKYGTDRRVAAQALWRLGQAQEQLGRFGAARQTYQRLRVSADEVKLIAAAEARLTVLADDEEWSEDERSPEARAPIVIEPLPPLPGYFRAPAPSPPASPDLAGSTTAETDDARVVLFGDLSVYNTETKESKRLTGGRAAAYPVLSGQGRNQQIAYFSWGGVAGSTPRQRTLYPGMPSTAELRLVNLDGTGDRLLARGDDLAWLRPYAWSPLPAQPNNNNNNNNGRSILALFERTSGVRQIVLVRVNNGAVRVVKSGTRLSVQDIGLSSDETFLAYQVPNPPALRQFDLVVLPVDARAVPVPERRYSLSQTPQRSAMATGDDLVIHVLSRLTFGPRPGDIERVKAMGIDAYIEQQLNPEQIADPVVDAKLAGFMSFKMDIPELLEKGGPPVAIAGRRRTTMFERPEFLARERKLAAGRPSRLTTAGADVQVIKAADAPVGFDIGTARMVRAVHSERQLHEVLVDFWMNHFNVDLGDNILASHFEEMAIRRHALGRFEDMLFAVARHPQMLFYLDNWRSSAPADVVSSRIEALEKTADIDGRLRLLERAPFLKQSKGLNENFARELLELHTVGVNGGYRQEDVVAVAKILTGWTIGTRGLVNAREEDGVFMFDPLMHVDGDKVVMGKTIKGGGVDEGEQLLKMLAEHESTARFISTKLARRLVADDPPAAVIENASRVFLKTGGDIREVVRTILTSAQFRSIQSFRVKIKKPFELVASALRATDASIDDLDAYNRLVSNRSAMVGMGERLYNHEAPDGHPDVGAAWMNANALLLRLEFANNLANGRVPGVKANLSSAQSLLTRLGIPKPTPLQIEQTRGMMQAAAGNVPATGVTPTAVTTAPKMMAGGSTGAGGSAPADTDAIVVAAMLGSPQFQKR
jgi:uncharacterized protein (DUF1800 family)